jgi:hypothetical protein
LELQEREPMKITSYLSPSRLIYLASLLVFSFFSSATFACTIDAWNGGVTGSPLAGSPNDTPDIQRVSGLCAMELSAAGSVKDTSPVTESTLIARFYVKADLNSGVPVIFEAFSDNAATSSLITVTFDGSNFVFNAGDGASGAIQGESGWNLVELSWISGVGMSFWVNTDSSEPETGSIAATAGTVESVVLGETSALDGTLTLDDYVSHRSTPVGGLLMGDANGSGGLTIADVVALFNELNGTLAEGQPDCNMSGGITIADVVCLFNAL